VTVFEGTEMLGGISQTAQYKGYRFDIGGYRFYTKVEPVERLWHESLEKEFVSVPRQSRIDYRDLAGAVRASGLHVDAFLARAKLEDLTEPTPAAVVLVRSPAFARANPSALVEEQPGYRRTVATR
jgi:phytoene dehydrogenase-like protein